VNLTGSRHSVPGGGALSRQSRPVPNSRMTAEAFGSGWTVDDQGRQPSPRHPRQAHDAITATADLRTSMGQLRPSWRAAPIVFSGLNDQIPRRVGVECGFEQRVENK
jgi:hypothetical protein